MWVLGSCCHNHLDQDAGVGNADVQIDVPGRKDPEFGALWDSEAEERKVSGQAREVAAKGLGRPEVEGTPRPRTPDTVGKTGESTATGSAHNDATDVAAFAATPHSAPNSEAIVEASDENLRDPQDVTAEKAADEASAPLLGSGTDEGKQNNDENSCPPAQKEAVVSLPADDRTKYVTMLRRLSTGTQVCPELMGMPEGARGDREVMFAALERSGEAFKLAAPSLRQDKQMVLEAVKLNWGAFAHAEPDFRADKDIAMAAVKRSGWALQHVGSALRTDRDIVLAAVAKSGGALEHAHPTFAADKEVVLAAVKQNGWALKFVDASLLADKDVAMTAVARSGCALQLVDAALRADKEVAMKAVKKDGGALEYVDRVLRADKEVVLAALAHNGGALKHASDDLRSNRDVVMTAVSRSGFALQHADSTLSADKEVVLTAVSQSAGSLQFAAEPLKSDKDILAACGDDKSSCCCFRG